MKLRFKWWWEKQKELEAADSGSACCKPLGKLLDLSKPQLLHLSNNTVCHIWQFWSWTALFLVSFLQESPRSPHKCCGLGGCGLGGAAHRSSEQWRPPVCGPSLPPACPYGHRGCTERTGVVQKEQSSESKLFPAALISAVGGENRRGVRQTQQKPTLATERKLNIYTATHTPYASQVTYDPCY